ncbi:MAG: hypothetical protein KDA96_27540 [Planctomycetaceae bacterium]|nr:hypothetical protein [Planctomycetaceae bacterium]
MSFLSDAGHHATAESCQSTAVAAGELASDRGNPRLAAYSRRPICVSYPDS